MESLKEEKDKRNKMFVRLNDFAENDPAVLEHMVREMGEAVEAVNGWTDNIFSIQGWMEKKFPSVDQVKMTIFSQVSPCSLAFPRIWNMTTRLQLLQDYNIQVTIHLLFVDAFSKLQGTIHNTA